MRRLLVFIVIVTGILGGIAAAVFLMISLIFGGPSFNTQHAAASVQIITSREGKDDLISIVERFASDEGFIVERGDYADEINLRLIRKDGVKLRVVSAAQGTDFQVFIYSDGAAGAWKTIWERFLNMVATKMGDNAEMK